MRMRANTARHLVCNTNGFLQSCVQSWRTERAGGRGWVKKVAGPKLILKWAYPDLLPQGVCGPEDRARRSAYCKRSLRTFFKKECLVWICLSSRILPLKPQVCEILFQVELWTYHKQYSATAWFQSAGPLPTWCYPSFSAPYGWVWLSLLNSWGTWSKE